MDRAGKDELAVGPVVAHPDLSDYEWHLVGVCIDRYVADLRSACAEDQGDPDGRPGTLGNDMQRELGVLRRKVVRR
jgi:hypothetical protein